MGDHQLGLGKGGGTGRGRRPREPDGADRPPAPSTQPRPQRLLFGQSATLWPGLPHPWQAMLGEGRWKACEPAEEMDVSWFNLTSFFRLFPASCCALRRSSSRLCDMLDRARLRSASPRVSRRPRPGSSLAGAVAVLGGLSWSDASPDSDSEPEPESLLLFSSSSGSFLTACEVLSAEVGGDDQTAPFSIPAPSRI